MLDAPILQILTMFPRGATNDQLLFRLGAGGLRSDPSAVLSALSRLSAQGAILRRGSRWVPAPFEASTAPGSLQDAAAHPPVAQGTLQAVPGQLGPALGEAAPLEPADVVEDWAGWSQILGYYASTQRQDPRGSVERYPDQHGSGWQLVSMRGRWWEDAPIRFDAANLPATFREALAAAGFRGSAAIGWPMTVVEAPEGTTVLPGLLFPAIWMLEDAGLTLRVQPVSPILNPAWLRVIRRRRAMREEQLIEAIRGSEEGDGLEVIAPRLAHALASLGGTVLRPFDLAQEMSLAGEGLRNTAALVLPDEAAFTRRVAEDISRIRRWDKPTRRETALSALIEGSGPVPTLLHPVVRPLPLSDAQMTAAEMGLSGTVTAIHGPPGTGKSQTIVSMIATAILTGQSVLFVARNHRALDEVEGRLADLFPDIPIVVRGRDAEGERDVSFLDAMRQIVNSPARDAATAATLRRSRESVQSRLRALGEQRQAAALRDEINTALSELSERADTLRGVGAVGRRSAWRRWIAALRWLRERLRHAAGRPLPETASLSEVDARMASLLRRLASLPEVEEADDAPSAGILTEIAKATVLPEPETLTTFRQRLADLDFQSGGAKVASMSPEDARLVLAHRPVWLISSLSVPARVPLVPALFDLAIFDEASQADIASSLPVMARSRRAVIVGDPQQLTFIPALGRAQEHALMDAAGLPKSGRAAWAQSVNSLFDFVAMRIPPGSVRLLSDQFRSAPAIVDYTSRAFYAGRLVARRDDQDFQTPKGFRAGLQWDDIKGRPTREDGGNVNHAEASHIVARLVALSRETGFDGSVGVISPFNAQVGLIRRLAEEALSAPQRLQMSLNIGTVDRWQGGEADVVFFSLVVGPGAPASAQTFLSRERRRFNVAISRARAVAIIVGDLSWARDSTLAHVADLAESATRPYERPKRGFDSIWERRMDAALKRRGLAAHSQYPVGSRVLDFALFEGSVKLDLEVDGVAFHTAAGGGRKTADRLRDRELMAKGWKVRRFWVWELQRDMEGCLDLVERDLGRR